MRGANRPNEPVDDDSDEFEEVMLNSNGKETKKLVKKIERNGAYESEGEDEDENPYASVRISIFISYHY